MSKMTDEQIKKALEVCSITNMALECKDCPYNTFNVRYCSLKLCEDALDLINRQQAEIEKLKVEIEEEHSISQSYSDLCDYKQKEIEMLKARDERRKKLNYDEGIKELKSEAIKEFAEQVKMAFYYEFDELIPSIMADKIDNLVKEMVGEGK